MKKTENKTEIDGMSDLKGQNITANPKISFSSDTHGTHFITVDGVEVAIDISKLNRKDLSVVINGLGAILSSIACYLRGS